MGKWSEEIRERWIWKRIRKTPTCWLWTGGVIKGYPVIRRGYPSENIMVHRLMLERSLGRPIAKGKIACHYCDIRRCVRVDKDHVYEGTFKQNTHDAIRNGLFQAKGNGLALHPERAARGENHGTHHYPERYRGERASQAVLTEKQVRTIRRLWKGRGRGPTQQQIAERFGVTRAAIEHVLLRTRWQHVL